MSDIELVIKIPEEVYKNIQSENFWLDSGLTLSNAYDFIKNGTPIPKGHGRLIDAGEYENSIRKRKHYFDNSTVIRCTEIALGNAPTIIEADTESE